MFKENKIVRFITQISTFESIYEENKATHVGKSDLSEIYIVMVNLPCTLIG